MPIYIAEAADVILAEREDANHIESLQHQISNVSKGLLGPALWARWYFCIGPVARLAYYSVTTLFNIQTLGEENNDLLAVTNPGSVKLVPLWRRIVLVFVTDNSQEASVYLALFFWEAIYIGKVASKLFRILGVLTLSRTNFGRFQCPICLLNKPPACTPCGHIFCWYCILKYCLNSLVINQEAVRCPHCRKEFIPNRIVPIFNL
uniref:RING-type E3 ubiquitin transferase n=1 Tax=Syphacia muris TaxID=451379 RepID=A0A0N5ALT2_9BILA